MSLDAIQRALLHVASEALAGIPTSHENVPFKPPQREKWAQVFFQPNIPSVASLGDEGRDETDGFVQIDLNYPLGTGTAEPRADFERIRAKFVAGSRPRHQTVMLADGAFGPDASLTRTTTATFWGLDAQPVRPYSNPQVIITNCGRNAGRVVDGWYRISLTITWYAQLARASA